MCILIHVNWKPFHILFICFARSISSFIYELNSNNIQFIYQIFNNNNNNTKKEAIYIINIFPVSAPRTLRIDCSHVTYVAVVVVAVAFVVVAVDFFLAKGRSSIRSHFSERMLRRSELETFLV